MDSDSISKLPQCKLPHSGMKILRYFLLVFGYIKVIIVVFNVLVYFVIVFSLFDSSFILFPHFKCINSVLIRCPL